MTEQDEPSTKRLRHSQSTTQSDEVESVEQTSPFCQLNDHCLYAVFLRLDVDSLCHIANVCQRFGPIAEQVFRRCHRQLYLHPSKKRVIYKFGHLITHISGSCGSRDEIAFDSIVKFCSPSLESLQLHFSKISRAGLDLLAPRLKSLSLHKCSADGSAKDFTFLARHFPQLKQLKVDCDDISPDTLAVILRVNRQLKKLDTGTEANDDFIDAITKHAKGLEELSCDDYGPWGKQKRNMNGLLRLRELKQLKVLSLNIKSYKYSNGVSQLIGALANGNIPLEKIKLRANSITSEDIINLAKMETL